MQILLYFHAENKNMLKFSFLNVAIFEKGYQMYYMYILKNSWINTAMKRTDQILCNKNRKINFMIRLSTQQ